MGAAATCRRAWTGSAPPSTRRSPSRAARSRRPFGVRRAVSAPPPSNGRADVERRTRRLQASAEAGSQPPRCAARRAETRGGSPPARTKGGGEQENVRKFK
eukprot:1915726-Pleurochrysis_carterae.AAC.1